MWICIIIRFYHIWYCFLVLKSCPTLFSAPWTVAQQVPLSMGFFPGKNTGVGCHFLLQGVFLTQELNPSLLHWQVDSLPLTSPGSPLPYFYHVKYYSLCKLLSLYLKILDVCLKIFKEIFCFSKVLADIQAKINFLKGFVLGKFLRIHSRAQIQECFSFITAKC